MTKHILEWLPAYHDGELSQSRRRQVETHVQDCPSCRAELEALQGLSALLRADPAPAHTPPERFAAQVALRLPRGQSARPAGKPQPLPRWVLGAPLTLIGVWAFLEAGLWVSSFLLTADWIIGAAPFTAWLATDNTVDLLGTLSVLNLALLAVVVSLWLAWLAFWWVWQQNHDLHVSMEYLEKEY